MIVSLVPIGALAALGGAYPSSTIPILVAASVAFLASGARIGAGLTRWLDVALMAMAAGVLLQVLPLPESIVGMASPHLQTLDAALHLDAASNATTLSVDPQLTRAGLSSLMSALFVFWAAREVFSRGGVRTAARIVAWVGFVVTLVALIQRVSAPEMLLWRWKPADPGSQPFGPFVNRNHFATWLLMAATLTAGYLVAHTRSQSSSRGTSVRLIVRDWLADGNGLVLAASLALMVLGIVASLSRAAILGGGAAVVAGALMAHREERRSTVRFVVATVLVLLSVTVWSNREGLARKFDAATTVSRPQIWQETLPVVRDFWLTGTGVGTYAPTMLHYQHAMRDLHFNQAHNEYLQVATEGGLLLLLPLVVAIVAGTALARRRLQEDRRVIVWLRIGAAAGLIAVAVQGVFETGLRMPANALLAALLAAIVLHEPRTTT